MKEFPTNKCGAKYGTGYCDAQCPHDMKWIHGEANVKDWKPSDNDPNAGVGHYGICCNEMDIWESNKHDQAFTPHTCSLMVISVVKVLIVVIMVKIGTRVC